MRNKVFKIEDWSSSNFNENTKTKKSSSCDDTSLKTVQINENDIEFLTQRIESSKIDIAPNYSDWRDVGFALSEHLGENGRKYYHRISCFYPNYSQVETDKQYSACLASRGSGITIRTLYYLAKRAGVDIAINHPSNRFEILGSDSTFEIKDLEETKLPVFSDNVFSDLPDILNPVVEKSISCEDRDILLLGSLMVFSACLPNIYGIYGERVVYPNLYLFVLSPASAGKGRLALCRKLVEPIHKSFREKSKIESEDFRKKQAEYASSKDKTNLEPPAVPPLRMLFIPANNSATGFSQLLNDNNGSGILFETEADTLSNALKSEYGNYSEGLRKAFHHEETAFNRRKDKEYVEISEPRLSVILSGTPAQYRLLIPNAENGLASRFITYRMNVQIIWNNVFSGDPCSSLDNYFFQLGLRYFDFYRYLNQLTQTVRFELNTEQQIEFNSRFDQLQVDYVALYGLEFIASVRRMGLIAFRLMMILTTLRVMDDGEIYNVLTCRDIDFNAVLSMVEVLLEHSAYQFKQLPTENKTYEKSTLKDKFLRNLPIEFSRKDYLSVADELNIPSKTADKYIKKYVTSGLINHFSHDQYSKI